MPSGIGAWSAGDGFTTSWDLDETLGGAGEDAPDAVMMLRVQRERMSGGFFPTEREYSDGYGPVSYTHLDVYKRQACR